MGLIDGLLGLGLALLVNGGDVEGASKTLKNSAYQNQKKMYDAYAQKGREMMKSSDPNVAKQGKDMYEKARAEKMALQREHEQEKIREAAIKRQEQRENRN